MIKIENLNKSFDGKPVLKDVSHVFEKGKVNLIIGKSGSGKTVLLKSLIGLHTVDSGHIFFDKIDMTTASAKVIKETRSQIGVVFQGGALFDSKSVIENVKFPLDMFTSMKEEEKRERARFFLKRVNLEGVDNLSPAEISGGMKKRVAIARAIVMQPEYLFCDEPNSGLDPYTSVVIDELIMELTHEYGMTTIVNTHDMNSVFGIGERILFISEGSNAWEGTKEEVADTDNELLNDFLFSSALMKQLKK